MVNDDLSEAAKKAQERLLANPRLSTKNKGYLDEYFIHLKAKNRDPSTIMKHCEGLTALFDGLKYPKDLKKVEKKDIDRAQAYINDLVVKKRTYDEVNKRFMFVNTKIHVAESTRNRWIVVWKYFYKWLLGEGLVFPKCVMELKQSNREDRKRLPDSLLTEDDIRKMVDTAQNLRDKAFISLLYETGARIGEILELKKKYIHLDANRPYIEVTGKTGPRSLGIATSVSYLGQYLETVQNISDDKPIWKEVGNNIYNKNAEPLEYDSIRRQIEKIAERAGIKKRVNPHTFRHSRATALSLILTESELCNYMGWVPGSGMAGVYVHLSGRQNLGSTYEKIYNLPHEEKKEEVKVINCPRCQLANDKSRFYCGRCGSPLTIEESMRANRALKWSDDVIQAILDDPDKKKMIIEKIAKDYLTAEKYLAKKGKKANDSG